MKRNVFSCLLKKAREVAVVRFYVTTLIMQKAGKMYSEFRNMKFICNSVYRVFGWKQYSMNAI